jgi:hypothetical protein
MVNPEHLEGAAGPGGASWRRRATSSAFEAIAASLPLRSVAYEPQRTTEGGYFVRVKRGWRDKLEAAAAGRGPERRDHPFGYVPPTFSAPRGGLAQRTKERTQNYEADRRGRRAGAGGAPRQPWTGGSCAHRYTTIGFLVPVAIEGPLQG